MSSTGPLLQLNDTCREGNCQSLDYDDSSCDGICKCCVGIHDAGDHNKCISACRKCRNFGSTWDPRRAMRPLDYTDIYTDLPGYATTGEFVEHFGMPDMNTGIVVGFIGRFAISLAGLLVLQKMNYIQMNVHNHQSKPTCHAKSIQQVST